MYYPMWHLEYEDLIVLKNNRGTEENRIRRLDYAIQTCGLFARRYVEKGNITLFSPDVAGGQLYKLFYEDMEKFEKLYVELENDPTVPKKVVSASDVWSTSPLAILLPRARMAPPLTPMPARFDTYCIMVEAVAPILSKLSSHSIRTQNENWRVGVRTPAIIGVGSEM